MKANINSTLSALAALVSIAVGCNGQPKTEPFDGTPMTTAAAVPVDLGFSTYLNAPPAKISYDLDSRFLLTVTKEQLHTARAIEDIVPGFFKQDGVTYTVVSIRVLEGDKETDLVEVGEGRLLNAAQKELLSSLGYGSNFVVRAQFTEKTSASGTPNWDLATPHVTVVPEKQAVNSTGKEALIEHVKQGTSVFPHIVNAQKLQPGKVHFTVDRSGVVTDVRLTESAGYPALDARVLELVNTFPGTWAPATNSAGEAVEQEFVFSFGTVGC